MSTFRFDKSKRISSKRDIEFLFSSGKSYLFFPFRLVVTQTTESDFPLKILVSVPKSKIKHAVKRNRIKRLTREAWRLNTQDIISKLETENKYFFAGLIYVHHELPEYKTVEKAVLKIIQQIKLIAKE